MKVKQLKEILSEMPDDALVVLAEDAEGNGFSPLGSYNTDMKYLPGRHPWRRGQVLAGTEVKAGSSKARPALVLWPTH